MSPPVHPAAPTASRGRSLRWRVMPNRHYASAYCMPTTILFDAPVGLIFTVDRRMARSSWVDYGMFMQNILLAARARGLDTCPQMAWALYPGLLTEILEIPGHQMVVCGMSLGHADANAAEN